MTTYLVILTADQHCGSTAGLCAPIVEIQSNTPETGPSDYHANRGQRWLFECWEDFLSRVEKAGKTVDKVIMIFDGDTVELDCKNRTYELITRNKATVMGLAVTMLEPLVKMSDYSVFLRGTPAHVGKSSWSEEEIAKDLKGEPCPRSKTYSWATLKANIGGIQFDVKHKRPAPGRKPWTKYNALNDLAAQMCLRQYRPHLVIGAHYHWLGDSDDNYPVRVIYLPGWKLPGEYELNFEDDPLATRIGGVLVYIDGGKYEVEKVSYIPKEAKLWTV